MIRQQFHIICLGVFLLQIAFQSPNCAGEVFLSDKRVAALKVRITQKTEPTYAAFLKMKSEADTILGNQPHAPSEWYVPGYYKDPEGHKKAKEVLANDANHAYELALMYRMTDDQKYAESAVRLINGWTTTLTRLSQKDDSMLSFSYHFPAFIFAAALLENNARSVWSVQDQAAFKEFVRSKALPMNTMGRENNWGNWGLVLVLASAAYLNDPHLFARGANRWKYFIDKQIADDGHLPLEVIRNNGLGDHGIWYSNFSLMPETLAAEILRVNGTDLFNYQSPSGHSLHQAYLKIIPWVSNPATFPYYKGDPGTAQSTTDYVSYWEILENHWPNNQARRFLEEKRPWSASHCAPCLTFTHGDLSDRL